MELSNYKSKWDSISISASLLCAIHCVVLPFFFTTLPLFNFDIIENIWIESFTILVSAFFGGWAIFNGYRKYHRNKFVVFIFLQGMLMLFFGNFLPDETGDMTLKLFGGISVIVAHINNWKLSKHCTICESKSSAS
ncbi:MAG: MerC domain-containing protein [Sediminibacterium sp.]|jgi:drug/metabolite transporter (DMT)-like permease